MIALPKWTQHAAPKCLSHAMEIGEQLISICRSLPHGDFHLWLEQEAGFSERLARYYMRVAYFREFIARRNPKPQTLREALRAVSGMRYRGKAA